jgi:two-component system, NarL family, captular synthesis response regulator RcsB
MNKEFHRSIRIALLDDHPVVLHGVSGQLKQVTDMSVVGEFASGRDLLAALATQEVDVLIMDYSLGPKDIDGVSLLRMLRLRFPLLEILVMSGHGNPATATLAMRAGARGFIGKSRPMHELIEAIRSVAARRRYIDPGLSRSLRYEDGNAPDIDEHGTMTLSGQASLSMREREVLRCVLDGMAVTSIARKFSRSVNTISTQKQSAYRKLGIRSDAELFKMQHSLSEMQ